MPPAKVGINLLPKNLRELGLSDKIVNWALSYGRYVLVLTLSVVIVSFGMRFTLDQKLSDLFDSIKDKQLFIEANADFETDFRQVQQKLIDIKTAKLEETGPAAVIETMANIIPPEIRFTSFTFGDGTFSISATSTDEAVIARFAKILARQSNLTDINVSAISLSGDNPEIKFSVTGKWRKKDIPTVK